MVKQKKVTKRASAKAKSEPEQTFETPNNEDWIGVTFEGHRNSWYGPFYYREGSCIYTETWSEAGQVARPFSEIEFWQVWQGETSAEYEERKKEIIAEHGEKSLTITDLWDLLKGANSIQGEWSTPKIGPAFKPEPVTDTFARPKDGSTIEVQTYVSFFPGSTARNVKSVQGVYFAATDRIYSKSRSIARDERRFHYGAPVLPFSEWIQFRLLNEDGTLKSDWQPGPRFKEWSAEDKIRRETNMFERNKKTYESRATMLHEYPRNEPDSKVRLVELQKLLKNSTNPDTQIPNVSTAGFEMSLPNGGGAFFVGKWREQLESKIDTLQKALRIVPSNERAAPETEGRCSVTVRAVAGTIGCSTSKITQDVRDGNKILGLTPVYRQKKAGGKILFSDSWFEKLQGKKEKIDAKNQMT